MASATGALAARLDGGAAVLQKAPRQSEPAAARAVHDAPAAPEAPVSHSPWRFDEILWEPSLMVRHTHAARGFGQWFTLRNARSRTLHPVPRRCLLMALTRLMHCIVGHRRLQRPRAMWRQRRPCCLR